MNWTQNSYLRLLVDNHITDLKPQYMSRYSAESFATLAAEAGIDAAMVYASDHNGNCTYPTRCGHPHAALQGRDFFGATINALSAREITPLGYYSVVFHRDPLRLHPEWSQQNADGTPSRSGRYLFCCPNHPGYRDFCQTQLAEVLAYPIAGLFIDMSFWPGVCFCPHCQNACRQQTGAPFPTVIDWTSPAWVRFQRWREQNMLDFASELSHFCQTVRPGLTVVHQFSPVIHGWLLGQNSASARASTYASGDFYGGRRQQRLACKIFAACSRQQPFEFMTSRCVNLRDHCSGKTADEMFLQCVTTLAHGGACLLIDAINPDGTLIPTFYQRLNQVTRRLEPCKKLLLRHQPRLEAETGLYFSAAGFISAALNGTPLASLTTDSDNMAVRKNPVLDELLGAAALLNSMHVPTQIVTPETTDLTGLNTLIVPNAAYLSPAECERLRHFVRTGGTLLATGQTSRFQTDGLGTGDFQLADLFGVTWQGEESGPVCYLRRPDDPDFIAVSGVPAPLVTAVGAHGLASLTLPDFPCNDPDHYASIHSNPPGRETAYAGLTVHPYGRGQCYYLAPALLSQPYDSQRQWARDILKPIVATPVNTPDTLPECVEVTLLRSTRQNAFILCLVNYQEELPVIPLPAFKLTLRLPASFRLRQITATDPANPPVSHYHAPLLELEIPRLEHSLFVEITGEPS